MSVHFVLKIKTFLSEEMLNMKFLEHHCVCVFSSFRHIEALVDAACDGSKTDNCAGNSVCSSTTGAGTCNCPGATTANTAKTWCSEGTVVHLGACTVDADCKSKSDVITSSSRWVITIIF